MKNLLTLLISLFTLNAFAQDGTLDSTFGVNGQVSTKTNILTGQGNFYFSKIGILQNGNIVRAGTITFGQDSSIILSCIRANGWLEYYFGTSTNGYLKIGSASSKIATQDLVITNNNKILIGAFCREAGNTYILLLKLNADGFFDNTFGINGQAKIAANIKTINQVLIQQNGSILVHADTFLYRFTSTGDIDPTFGTAGKINVANGSRITISPTNKIIVGAGGYSISIKRYSANGVLDTSFANNGHYYRYVPEINNGVYRIFESYTNLNIKCDSLDGFNLVYQKYVVGVDNKNIVGNMETPKFVFTRMLQQGILDSANTCMQNTIRNYASLNLVLFQSNGKNILVENGEDFYATRWYKQCSGEDITFTMNKRKTVFRTILLNNDTAIYLLVTNYKTDFQYPDSTTLFKIKTSLNNYQAHKPVAKIWVDKNTGNTNTSFSFRDSSEHGPLQRLWVFTPNNVTYLLNSSSTSTNPTVRFTQNGKYTVKLVVGNLMGNDSVVQNQLVDINVKPVPQFSVSTNLALPSSKIYLTDSSLNNPNKWKWVFTQPNVVFQSGTSDTSQNPVVRFTQPGFYNIKLVATSPFGSDSITKQNVITVVSSGIPVANFTASKTYALTSTPIKLFNQSSYNQQNNQWYISPSVGYTYISGDSTSDNPILQFDSAGTYSVALVVKNDWGKDSVIKIDYLHIGNQKVSAYFKASKTNGTTYDTVVVVDSCINAANRTWKITPNTYTRLSDSTLIFNKDGLYTLQLIASNAFDADTFTRTNYINIYTPLPQPLFYADKTGGYVGDTITLIDTSLYVQSRQWQITPATYIKSPNILVPTYYTLNWDPKILVFTKGGVYSVKLSATNIKGTYELLRTNYINITSVGLDEALQNNAEVTLYPNPAQNQLTVLCNVAQIQAIHLLELSGKMLHTFTNNTTLNLSQCASGMYLVKIETDKGTVFKKLIISK